MKPMLLLRLATLVTCLAIFSTFESTAQQAVIGTGTSVNGSTGYPAPYGNYYWGARHQMLIRASEISGNCGPMNQLNSLNLPFLAPTTVLL